MTAGVTEGVFSAELAQLKSQGLLRKLPQPFAVPGPTVEINGKRLICFSSNNYLGLATHPFVVEASCRAVRDFGCGSTGSRLLSGNLSIHEALEKQIAIFKGAESALVFNSGYTANLSLLSTLAGEGDLIISDKLNHASLHDGAMKSRAETRVIPHGNWKQAEDILKDRPAKRRFLVTDGVFSMDGDVAPLPDILALARRYEAILVLDEAHATGVLGADGKGTFQYYGISPDPEKLEIPDIIQMGTFGKALGGFGAYVTCRAETREYLINKARPFIFSTALPPSVLGAAMGALELLPSIKDRIELLRANSKMFREQLTKAGFFKTMPKTIDETIDETPIIPVLLGTPELALRFAGRLREFGIDARAVRPPAVARNGSRVRVTLMATHSEEQLQTAITAFAAVGKEFAMI